MIINSYEELITFLKENDLSKKEVESIVNQSLKVWFVKDYETREAMIDDLVAFWNEHGNNPDGCIPLFIDSNL